MNIPTAFSENPSFTDYIRGLGAERPTTPPEQVEEVLALLWTSLKDAIRRRGLWERPPSFLGVYGLPSWSQAEGSLPFRPGGSSDAMELLLACYKYVFVDRYPYLARQLRARPDIDGLVFRNIRNFVHDTQKKHDPLGFRVFDLVRAAVRESVEDGELFVLGAAAKLRNDTVLGFMDRPRATRPTPPARLSEIVEVWNDTLLPDLITGSGPVRARVIATLRMLVATLPARGVRSFRFRDLVEPLKADVRRRWGALYDHSEGPRAVEEDAQEVLSFVRSVAPDSAFEARDEYQKLGACLDAALENLDETPAVRRHLGRLWHFLRLYAAPEGGADDELPSRRKLAEALGIPRNLMSRLFGRLGELVDACRASLRAASAESVSMESASMGRASTGSASTGSTSADAVPGLSGGPEDRDTVTWWVEHWSVEARQRAAREDEAEQEGAENEAAENEAAKNEGADPSEAAVSSAQPRRLGVSRQARISRGPLALAASLVLVLSLILLLPLERLPPRLPETDGVIVNPPRAQFISGESRGLGAEVEISSDDTWVELLFSARDSEAGYRLEISGEDGREVWSGEIPWDRLIGMSVLVPSSRFPPGEYVLRLSVVSENGVAELESEHFLTVKENR